MIILVKRLLLFILFLLAPHVAFATDLAQAQVGDFIVYGYKQQEMFLRIVKKEGTITVIEEISMPRMAGRNWQEWLKLKAPSHTSWTITTLENGKISSIFNVDERQFLPAEETFQLLPTLLKLTLTPVPESEQKRIGPEPLAGEVDLRPLWRPKIVFEGKEQHPKVDVFHVLWPKDASELSGKPFDLYFPQSDALTYLPYWIEISAVSKVKIETIDSGRGLMNSLPTAFVDNFRQKKTP